jgi:Tfp pilus assembly protein PilX
MSQKLEELKNNLDEALGQRDAHVKEMADTFTQQNMDRLNALQRMVADAKAAFEKAEALTAAGEGVSENITSSDEETCVVTLIRGGKNDRCVEIPANTSLADLMGTLGENPTGLTFKKRVGPGQTAEITNLGNKIGPGQHEFFVTPKVAGGN